MGEDVSASMRLAVTIMLLSAFLMASTNLFVISDSLLIGYAEDFAFTVGSVGSETLMAVNRERAVGAPLAYKLIQEHILQINELEITYLDGTVTSDCETLLKRAAKSVRMFVAADATGVYRIKVQEVE